jgi:hypothetical protein
MGGVSCAKKDEYGIRVFNLAYAGDQEASYLIDELSRRAEDAARAGNIAYFAIRSYGKRFLGVARLGM